HPSVNPTNSVIKVNNSGTAIYKGDTIAQAGGVNRLYVANFFIGNVDVFDANYTGVTLPAGAFTDPNIPAGFAPFNVQNIGGNVYVTYAKQDADKEDDVPGLGNGFIKVFDTSGVLVRRCASQGSLTSRWGMAVAPATFGVFS